jgi:hypothetical protein
MRERAASIHCADRVTAMQSDNDEMLRLKFKVPKSVRARLSAEIKEALVKAMLLGSRAPRRL